MDFFVHISREHPSPLSTDHSSMAHFPEIIIPSVDQGMPRTPSAPFLESISGAGSPKLYHCPLRNADEQHRLYSQRLAQEVKSSRHTEGYARSTEGILECKIQYVFSGHFFLFSTTYSLQEFLAIQFRYTSPYIYSMNKPNTPTKLKGNHDPQPWDA